MFVDQRGPRPAVLGGAVLLAVGYFPLHQAYDSASGSVPLLCLFSYMSGLGGCMAFAAAVKTSALNWPQHRGTATAFPLAAFGLSAFFFSLLGSVFFPGDPSAFLELLAWGTCGMTLGGFFFLKVHHQSSYEAVPDSEDHHGRQSTSSRHSRQGSSDEPKVYRSSRAVAEPGMFTNPSSSSSSSTRTSTSSPVPALASSSAPAPDLTASPGIPFEPESGRVVTHENPEDLEAGETSPLTSRPSSRTGEALLGNNHINNDRSHRVDIRGLALMRSLGFWQLFTIMGILAGVGLMTIKYGTPPSTSGMSSADLFEATLATTPRLFGNTLTRRLPTSSSSTASKCMCRPFPSAASLVDYSAVSPIPTYPVFSLSHNSSRCWLRFLGQPTSRQQALVSCRRLCRLLPRSSLCLAHREPQPARPSLGFVRSRLWLPVWRFPFDCGRNLWHPRAEPELGLLDHGSSYLVQHLQHFLW